MRDSFNLMGKKTFECLRKSKVALSNKRFEGN